MAWQRLFTAAACLAVAGGVVAFASTHRAGGQAAAQASPAAGWTALTVDVVSAASDQLRAVRVTDGPVHLHAVIVSNAKVAVFAGPGMTMNGVRPNEGETVARVVNTTGEQATTDRVELDITLSGGLWLAWNAESADAVITVLYRPL